jgi:hypothetical protein
MNFLGRHYTRGVKTATVVDELLRTPLVSRCYTATVVDELLRAPLVSGC